MSKSFYKTVSILVVLFAIGIPLTCSYIRGKKFDDKMKNNSVVVNGLIVNYKKRYKLADAFFYKFNYNGTIYSFESSASSSSSDYAKLSTYMIGKTVPVIVNIEEPEKYSKALIVPEDFEEYGMSFPDSMKWVVRILDK